MISGVFLVNKDGTIIIEKQYRDNIPRSQVDVACLSIREAATREPAPIQSSGKYSIILHKQNEIWVVGICEGDDFALIGVNICQYIGLLVDSLLRGGATELSIKDDYPTVYQILDFAVDFGYVFLNEPNTILTLLNQPKTDLSKGIRLQLDLERPWRSLGVSHLTNELYVDVVETVDIIVSQFGKTDFCHIRGAINVSCQMAQTPLVKMFLSPSTRFEDVTFHRCAQIDMPDQKMIPFTPPEGKFTLVNYRITATQQTLPVWIVPKFNWSKGGCTFEIVVRPDALLPKAIEGLTVTFDVPNGVTTPALLPEYGKAVFDASTNEVVWTLGNFSKKEPTKLTGSASYPLDFELGGRYPTVTAAFSTVGSIPSKIKLDKIEVEDVKYKLFKGVKYTTQAGNYEFRTGL